VQKAVAQSATIVEQAFKLGQHSPLGIGAGVPSGQIFKSIVQKAVAHLSTSGLVLQALNDGQQPPTGTGGRVPSGQILRSMVHMTRRQSGLSGKIAPYAIARVTSKQMRDFMFADCQLLITE